jgi:hypothetical protein
MNRRPLNHLPSQAANPRLGNLPRRLHLSRMTTGDSPHRRSLLPLIDNKIALLGTIGAEALYRRSPDACPERSRRVILELQYKSNYQ